MSKTFTDGYHLSKLLTVTNCIVSKHTVYDADNAAISTLCLCTGEWTEPARHQSFIISSERLRTGEWTEPASLGTGHSLSVVNVCVQVNGQSLLGTGHSLSVVNVCTYVA